MLLYCRNSLWCRNVFVNNFPCTNVHCYLTNGDNLGFIIYWLINILLMELENNKENPEFLWESWTHIKVARPLSPLYLQIAAFQQLCNLWLTNFWVYVIKCYRMVSYFISPQHAWVSWNTCVHVRNPKFQIWEREKLIDMHEYVGILVWACSNACMLEYLYARVCWHPCVNTNCKPFFLEREKALCR